MASRNKFLKILSFKGKLDNTLNTALDLGKISTCQEGILNQIPQPPL